MAQINFISLSNEWTQVTGLEEGTTYRIQNRGPAKIIAIDTDNQPEEGSDAGDLVLPYEIGEYEKGTGDLYLRAFDGVSSINITSKE